MPTRIGYIKHTGTRSVVFLQSNSAFWDASRVKLGSGTGVIPANSVEVRGICIVIPLVSGVKHNPENSPIRAKPNVVANIRPTPV